MFLRKIIVLMIILAVPLLISAEAKLLISLDLDSVNNLNLLEQMKIRVYHQAGSDLITVVNPSVIRVLDDNRYSFEILDQNYQQGSVYLVSSKKETEFNIRSEWGSVLYQKNRKALVKTAFLSEDILFSGYQAVELKPSPRLFKNIRIHDNLRINDELEMLISDFTQQMDIDNITATIQSLEDFQTRFCLADNRDEVAQWIKDEFISIGFTDVVIDSFYVSSYSFINFEPTWQKNIVATLPGTINPEDYIVIGAHWDSIVTPNVNVSFHTAPGADDNATGVAATMEIARVMLDNDYQPKKTIKFVAFGIEELGLIGSYHYAGQAYENNDRIHLMINNDMIGYNTLPQSDWQLRVIPYSGFYYLMDTSFFIMEEFTTLEGYYDFGSSPGSDSYPFYYYGYPAIFFFERHFNPYYHSVSDLLINLDLDYCTEATKVSMGMALYYDARPVAPDDFVLFNGGAGDNLIVQFNYNPSDNFSHYNVYLGESPGNYDLTWTTSENMFEIDGLTNETEYFVGISVENAYELESVIVERSMLTSSFPGIPQNIQVSVTDEVAHLSWTESYDWDFAGFNIYRSENSELDFSLLNSQPFNDNFYTDNTMEPGTLYYYAITSLDDEGNESELSEIVYARLMTMDQGIFVVSFTRPGSGVFNPDLNDINDFYDNVLADFDFDFFDAHSNDLSIIDLGAYSSLLIHFSSINSANLLSTSKQNALLEYYNMGGNIMFNGYIPSQIFNQSLLDVFGVVSTNLSPNARFKGAMDLIDGYQYLAVDEEKAPDVFENHLNHIESLAPAGGVLEIYSYDSEFDPDSSQGSMVGETVGLEKTTDSNKTVMLSFPLYFIQEEHAKNLLNFIFHVRFQEELETGQPELVQLSDRLYRNYPNPFNPVTEIRYEIINPARVKLEVFNIKGQLINVLVDDYKASGVYQVSWRGTDQNNNLLPSGVYFYRLQTPEVTTTRKMLLLK